MDQANFWLEEKCPEIVGPKITAFIFFRKACIYFPEFLHLFLGRFSRFAINEIIKVF